MDRGGIEPPTHGFSVRYQTAARCQSPFSFGNLLALKGGLSARLFTRAHVCSNTATHARSLADTARAIGEQCLRFFSLWLPLGATKEPSGIPHFFRGIRREMESDSK